MPACPKCGANVEATARFCASCGATLPAAAPYPSPYPYYVPPPKRNNVALIIVVVVILVIAVPTVLAAVLYVMVSGLIGGPTTSKPVLSFTTAMPVTNGYQLTLASASQALAPANYKVNLQINTTTGSAVAMPTTSGGSVSITVAGYTGTFSVTWTDIGGERTLNGGDSFTVTRTGGLPAASSYTFYLLWSDGSQIANVSWQTP